MYRIGHSSPQAALRYQHATARRDRTIADGISDLIGTERTNGCEPRRAALLPDGEQGNLT